MYPVFSGKSASAFSEAVAETPEEAEEFLDDCMAVVCDTRKEALAYLEEGMDVSGMSEEEILESEEVFALPSGRYLIVGSMTGKGKET